jgi:hypothetical protein
LSSNYDPSMEAGRLRSATDRKFAEEKLGESLTNYGRVIGKVEPSGLALVGSFGLKGSLEIAVDRK